MGRLSDAEWKVMNSVWQLSRATARDVHDQLEPETGWAYTTVKTMMARLVEKGALNVRMRGNQSVYEPVLSRRKARRKAVRALMDRAFDGAMGSMVHFMVAAEKLSPRERAELIRMLKEQEKKR